MQQINIHEAKTNLSALVKEAASGKPFVIAVYGKPMVKVVPLYREAPLPRIGFMKDQITIPENFDHLNENEIAALFDGAGDVQ